MHFPAYISLSPKWIRQLKKTGVVLLLSGGADSVALFHLLLNRVRTKKLGRFIALHVNYGLRGAESELDEEFVRSLCREHQIELVVMRRQVPHGSGIQNKARHIRYDEAFALAQKNNFPMVVSGHHFDDQIETLFQRWRRGAGVSGMLGMRVLRQDQSGVHVYRPLLHAGKDQILNWLLYHQHQFREDQSNSKVDYERNRIRKKLLLRPFSASDRLLLKNASEQLLCLDEYWRARLNRVLVEFPIGVPKEYLNGWSHELLFRYLQWHASQYNYELSRSSFNQFLMDKKLQYKNFVWEWQSDGLWLLPIELPSVVVKAPGLYRYLDCTIIMKHLVNVKRVRSSLLKSNQVMPKKLFMDAARVSYPLTIRATAQGDKFSSYGHENQKKIGGLFRQKGIGVLQRRLWPVLQDASGQVIAALGLEVSNHVRVDAQTKKILSVDWVQANALLDR